MATLDEHVSRLMGDLLLTVAKQATEIDTLREALAVAHAQAAAMTPPPAEAQP
jgi:hypothetical protein